MILEKKEVDKLRNQILEERIYDGEVYLLQKTTFSKFDNSFELEYKRNNLRIITFAYVNEFKELIQRYEETEEKNTNEQSS